jgi:hypothetical protein
VSESEVGGGVSFDSLATLMSVGAAYIDYSHEGVSHRSNTRSTHLERTSRTQRVIRGQRAQWRKGAADTGVVDGDGDGDVRGEEGGTVKYSISVAGITGAIMAHIHTGVADSAGPIVVPLFSATPPTGPHHRHPRQRKLHVDEHPDPGISLDSLLTLMRAGRTT